PCWASVCPTVTTGSWVGRNQRRRHHTTSKKALHKQGPMPTDRGRGLLGPPALHAEQAYTLPVTGPPNLPKIRTEISSARGGSGTPLNCSWRSPGWSQALV